MGMKLFDDVGDDDVEEISKIEINKEFAKRYEHNKKREDLQKLEEMKKKGLIDESGSDSESDSESESEDSDDIKKEVEFFDALLKVRKKDPILKEKDAKLFESSDDDEDEDDDDEGGERKERKKAEKKKKKPKYLKDVMAQHLVEEGPEFEEEEEGVKGGKKVKTFAQEQEDLRKEVLNAIAEAERETDEMGDGFLRPKEREDEEDDDEGEGSEEIKKRLDEYFGEDEKLDENDMFLKDFFKNKLWIDKDKGKKVIEDDLAEISDDEEALEKQEDYERGFNFRFEENASDRVLGHSRFVDGSVRKETNARKQQRERKKERMAQAEIERQEEVKRLKNLKKKEIQEKLDKIREISGIKSSMPLTEEDLEEDFDPDEFDKKMKTAFGDDYYKAEDADPGFGSDSDEGESDLEKPNFEKEDELLGLPKDWDVTEEGDEGEEVSDEGDEMDSEDEEVRDEDAVRDSEGDDQLQPGEGKRKRKRKLSLKEKVALDKELEELYKLDYEDTIGDLKTRFKYTPVAPRRYGLNAKDVLLMDEKELNQYVSLKKLAPYREKEWKVHPMQRSNFMKKKGLLLQGLDGQMSQKKRRKTDGSGLGETSKETRTHSHNDVKAQGEQPSKDDSTLSRKARRKRNQKEKKLSQERLIAYGKIPSSSTHKPKS